MVHMPKNKTDKMQDFTLLLALKMISYCASTMYMVIP